MKDKLKKAIELLNKSVCPHCENRWEKFEGNIPCPWCTERRVLLAEVESSEDKEECEHPFADVMSKCNGEINHCLKCGERF